MPKGRPGRDFYLATADEIRAGRTTDTYFLRTLEVLKKAGRDRAKKSTHPERFDDYGIEVEKEQPEEPNPKREGDEQQRCQPRLEIGWKGECGEKKVVDRVNHQADQPCFEGVALGLPRVSTTKHRDNAEQ